MEDIFVVSDNIITSLGFTTKENFEMIGKDVTGIHLHENKLISEEPFYASLVETERLDESFAALADPGLFTRFEKLVILSVQDALMRSDVDPRDPATLFVLSTTKGNVELLQSPDHHHGSPYLWESGKRIRDFFQFANTPVIVSNACISGLLAIITGVRYLRSGRFDHAIISGADVVSEFIYAGFNSFKSLSQGPCRPFDKTRDGLSLGEGVGSILISKRLGSGGVRVGEGAVSNDANHISGPSRTGEGLFLAIKKVLAGFGEHVDYISAHGTATPYNDEMEAIAFSRAGLSEVPVNSMKGYWGHTLGAAGMVESIASIWSIRNNLLIGTKGFNETGVSQPVVVTEQHVTPKTPIRNCLKVASGFGGCNAALTFFK